MNVIKVDYNAIPVTMPVTIPVTSKKRVSSNKEIEDADNPILEEPVSNEVKCVYDYMPKKYLKEYNNPNFKHHLLNVPLRMIIVGFSGAGKTQLLFHLIEKMRGTYENIKVFAKEKDEPLYNYLADSIPADQFQIYNGISQLTNLDNKEKTEQTYNPTMQHLLIFDDLMLVQDQTKIIEYFVRGRKIAKGISLIYLTQSYFEVPITIRKNITYLILKKISNEGDLGRIMKEYSLGCSKEFLMDTYLQCTSQKKMDFLMIDIEAPPEKKFRRNLLEILPPEKRKSSKKKEVDSDSEEDR
jgi:hypothetical protein